MRIRTETGAGKHQVSLAGRFDAHEANAFRLAVGAAAGRSGGDRSRRPGQRRFRRLERSCRVAVARSGRRQHTAVTWCSSTSRTRCGSSSN